MVNFHKFHRHWGENCFSTYYRETKIKSVYFCQYTLKWSELRLLTLDFVSTAAQRWRAVLANRFRSSLTLDFVFTATQRWRAVLANRFRSSQSVRAKSTIRLCGIYMRSRPSVRSRWLDIARVRFYFPIKTQSRTRLISSYLMRTSLAGAH